MSDVDFKRLAKELAGKQKHSSSLLLLIVITLVLVTFVWAAVTELDNVVRGSGKTVSEAQNQLVQSSEPGVIRKRYVNEGDFVKKGGLLFDIDPVDAKAQLNQAQKRYSTLTVKSIRLKAEVENKVPTFSQSLLESAPNAVSTELVISSCLDFESATFLIILRTTFLCHLSACI
jgi:adhesin transport system membrane fusion protein